MVVNDVEDEVVMGFLTLPTSAISLRGLAYFRSRRAEIPEAGLEQ